MKSETKKKKKLLNILLSIFYVIFTISFTTIFITSIFRDGCVYYKLNHLVYFFVSVLILLIWYFLYKIICNIFYKIDEKKKRIIYIVTFFLIALLLIFFFIVLDVPLGWDYDVIYSQARSFALTGQRTKLAVYPEYFQYFPNNISIFLIEFIVIKLAMIFSIENFVPVLEMFNGLLIFLAILLIFLYCKKMYDDKKAYFSLLVSISFIPLFLYLPIFYSDTFSVIFLPLILYIYCYIDFNKLKCKDIILSIILILIIYIGLKIKVTLLFILFGLFIEFIKKHNLKRTIIICLVIFVSFFVLNLCWNTAIQNHFKVNDYGKIPITHWIMMGIEDPKYDNSSRNSYGGYNLRDYELTQSYPHGEDSIDMHIKEIKKRIKSYSIIELLDYYNKKNVNIWGDGSYYSAIKLNIGNKNKSNNIQKLLSGEDKYKVLLYIEEGVQIAFLYILVYSGIYSLKNKKYDFSYIHIPILVILFFLTIWEGRSRYLYNYIPLFIITITYYIDKINIFFKFRRKKK